ncbi:Shugoshin 2 [Bagarius yarrelli]|uniref:Shugoshin 2 n=1 Tax=Bagarius yarrelli TaxID=175774 RepID=A0A556U4U2_BAGYA|nr:Shugoshin 2 [Bagarius yarrelli]
MEKKANPIQQTAAKIKTKIHNTSSFFKLSLKTNNKALALALVAQKQKSKQLEMETMRLQKALQSLNFDLAIQRHKNKQMFAVLREFYNNSINCMAKAVDLISKEEGAESLDMELTEDSCQTEKDATALLPEPNNKSSLSTCGEERNVQCPGGNVTVVNSSQPRSSLPKPEDKPRSPEVDHAAPQNPLYDSTMEITLVDNNAEIITVQTNPKKTCEDDQKRMKENESFSASGRESIVLNHHKAAVEPSNLKYTTVNTSMQTSCETQLKTCTNPSDSSRKEECIPQWVEPVHEGEESVAARRKTHVTSRNGKSIRRVNSQKLSAGYTDSRQTYVISPHVSSFVSAGDDLDDYFSEQKVGNQTRNKENLHNLNVSKVKSTEKNAEMLKTQSNSTNSRKTYVILHKSKPQSRKTKVSSLTMDLSVQESAEYTDVHGDMQEKQVHAETAQSKQSTQSLPKRDECFMVKNRGTYVIHTAQMSACSENSNQSLDIHANVISAETPSAITMETSPDVQRTSRMTEGQQLEQEVSLIQDTRDFLKCSQTISDDVFLENSSDRSSAVHTKEKEPKKTVMKERKKNIAVRDNASGKKRRLKYSANQNLDILPKEIPLPDGNLKKISSNVLERESGKFNSSALEEAFMDEPVVETGDTDKSCVGQSNDKDDSDTDDIGVNMKKVNSKRHNIQYHKSKCRETFVVASDCNSHINGKENNFGSTEKSLPTDFHKESEISFEKDAEFVPCPERNGQSTPRKAEQLRHSELFSEDRPPWESLDFGSTESLVSDSLVTIQKDSQNISSKTIDIYEEPGWDMPQQPPDERVMKSLTNTDLTANPLSRSRRKATPVSYKEPTLNCGCYIGQKLRENDFDPKGKSSTSALDDLSNIVHPFSLSCHPFAMLSAFKAVDCARKHTQMLKRWNTLRNKKASAGLEKESSPTPSSLSSFSDSENSLKELTKHYEGFERNYSRDEGDPSNN